MCKIDKNKEKQEVIVTPEMVKAVKDIIESGDVWISFDEIYGHACLEEDAERIIRAALLASATYT